MQASKESVSTDQSSQNPDSTQDQTDGEARISLHAQSPHAVAGSSSSQDDGNHHSAALPVSLQKHNPMSESRSHADLQRVSCGESIKTAMENINFSIGRSSRRPTDRLDTNPVLARLGHRRAESTVVPTSVVSEPVVRTNSAPPISTPAAPNARKPNSQATFEGLPGELRNQVYHLLFAGHPTILALRDNRLYNMTAVPNRKSYFKLLPGLAYTNRRAYNEIATFLLENRTMEISVLADLHYFEDTLEQLPGQKGWNSVKSMRFTRFSDLATSPARTRELFDCIARCRNIEQLTLQVKLDLLHMPEHGAAYRQLAFLNGTPGVKSPDQVAATYELDLLFDLPNLQKLTLICEWHREGPVRCTPRTMTTFWDLQDWVARGFARQAENVKAVIQSLPFNDPKEMGAWTVRIKRGKSKNAV
ncbi:hypothetical protein P171DRAFT_435633 [Karstenula rhodostoma CBS 690.94]|uniref:Uncharacterized protein n=1 Tax=Karstenula rhodostoma CBS 690.94 TaxID=1392251 RepID=A0A9P4P999_9PLEO|nr:hypothetical protein P171DRAFT_435633 [Karstenula rhodostoma CBS 690.94]